MKHIKIIIFIFPIILLSGCYDRVPIERTSVVSGSAQDIIDDNLLSASLEYLIFTGKEKISKTVSTQTGQSIYDIFNKRLLEAKKTYLTGTIRSLIISEDRARYGIDDIIDSFMRDQERNINTTVVVCKDKAVDIIKIEPKESNTMSSEIEDLIKSSYQTNFNQRDTNIKDLYNMRFQEGRRIMLPYIEKYKDTVKISSVAVFEKDKMIFKIPSEDVKYVNLIRNHDTLGYLNFSGEKPLESFDIYCKVNRKVKADIKNDNINYNIKITLNSLIKENSINKFKEMDKKTIDTIQDTYSKELKSKLESIIEKYKSNYGVDVFDIQKYAVAKLGKDKADYVSSKFKDSNINIEVKIKINSIGRVIR
ncbi:Ger(x)C family spore germination protein [Caloramator sp. E03]|uniref:Ger(x)C family spore germination protein n=1 Tax=Caloramator sp. E03 TaxID=2576307 RepID=UPI00143DEE64|nr:Ger(x)C family spore germination protein [Caloramator sp. E03]